MGAVESADIGGFVAVVEEDRGHLKAIISTKTRRASSTLAVHKRREFTDERQPLIRNARPRCFDDQLARAHRRSEVYLSLHILRGKQMQRNRRNTSSDSFMTRIDFYRAQVDTALHKELRQRHESPFFTPFANAFIGGKRLRPIIVLLAYDSVGGRGGDPLPAAVAVELAHMESLIHDDIIDGDGMRRDTKAFHARYGQEMAVLSADFALSMILSIAARYSDPRIASTLATATAQMCEGELLERRISKMKKTVHPSVYQGIVLKKTASLFEAAASMGALIGNATPTDHSALAAYARALGVAYQIHDDIIDWAQNRTINLNVKDMHRSLDAYLHDTANSFIREAVDELRPLKSSEAKRHLVQLAELIDTKALRPEL
jgi:octaprenyl-diphosphate synthase